MTLGDQPWVGTEAIMRLAREVKKTIRKVNALEKIAIPDLEETVRSIESRLEESERDAFVLMKMVNSRIERGASRQGELKEGGRE